MRNVSLLLCLALVPSAAQALLPGAAKLGNLTPKKS
jgi:hypothetical protein